MEKGYRGLTYELHPDVKPEPEEAAHIEPEEVSNAYEVLRQRFACDTAVGERLLHLTGGESGPAPCVSSGHEEPQGPAAEEDAAADGGTLPQKRSRSWADEDSDTCAERRRRTAEAMRRFRKRADEDPERRAERLAAQAARAARARANEDPETRALRLAAQAARAAQRRAEEDPEKRAARLAADAARAARKRATEDPESRAQRLAAQAAKAAERRAEEDQEKRAARLAADAARAARKRAEEDPEKRAQRLAAQAARVAQRRAEETPEKRAARLAAEAARAAARRRSRAGSQEPSRSASAAADPAADREAYWAVSEGDADDEGAAASGEAWHEQGDPGALLSGVLAAQGGGDQPAVTGCDDYDVARADAVAHDSLVALAQACADSLAD